MEKDLLNDFVKTGHGMARFLKEHGVQFVFGVPDGHTLGFYDGILATEGIKHILFNDERSAAFAADAYARVTGMLGVCDAGAAGAMNFPIALAEAKGSASPVLAIVGVVKSHDVLKNIPHDINVAEALAPVTKWTGKVLDTVNLPRFMNYAIKQAINGKPGPVALVIAENVITSSELKLKDFVPRVAGSCSLNSCRSVPASGEIDKAIKMIRTSKQPALFVGDGALISEAYAEVAELSIILKAPVFSTISGKGIMIQKDDEDNLYFGTIGLFGESPNHKFVRNNVDLLVVIGNRLTEDDTANFKIPPQNLEMIQIDIDPAEIGLSYNPLGVVGDPKSALVEIIRNLKSSIVENPKSETENINKRSENLKALRLSHQQYREKDTAKWMNSEPIKPQRVLKTISDNMTEKDYLITDASSSSRWIGAYFPVKSIGRKIITARGVGPTGFGVGALIGTCFAADLMRINHEEPKKVLFTGDGGIMNGGINEFETIQKLDLNCTIVVINNASLGYVRFAQNVLYGKRYFETDRPDTDFARLAEAFGGRGYRVDKLIGLDSAIKEAINCDGFNVVDVVIDRNELLPPIHY